MSDERRMVGLLSDDYDLLKSIQDRVEAVLPRGARYSLSNITGEMLRRYGDQFVESIDKIGRESDDERSD